MGLIKHQRKHAKPDLSKIGGARSPWPLKGCTEATAGFKIREEQAIGCMVTLQAVSRCTDFWIVSVTVPLTRAGTSGGTLVVLSMVVGNSMHRRQSSRSIFPGDRATTRLDGVARPPILGITTTARLISLIRGRRRLLVLDPARELGREKLAAGHAAKYADSAAVVTDAKQR